MKDYIHTYSGKKFCPLDPKIEDIDINDISHALSLMIRANGHYKYFYSVAQHSINCYKEAVARNYSKKVQLACLLHDASEAYISDITRPVKKNLSEYRVIEKNLQDKIYRKFLGEDLNENEIKFIGDIDDCILHFEFIELMGVIREDFHCECNAKFDFSKRDFEEVEREFLEIFKSFNKF